jgi:hypothetical protein
MSCAFVTISKSGVVASKSSARIDSSAARSFRS